MNTGFLTFALTSKINVSILISAYLINNISMSSNEESVSQISTNGENSNAIKKKQKKGIIYLATIPPYMNVTRIRETFVQYGEIGRVYMALAENDIKLGQTPKVNKKRNIAKKFTEGWIEFERKSIAKKIAVMLNNNQVSSRKKSKHFDCIWNIKYLPKFKWVHLHERLAYEKAARRQKLRTEIELAKKKSNYFSLNLDKHQKNKRFINKEYVDLQQTIPKDDTESVKIDKPTDPEERKDFLKSLFT